MTSSTLRLNFPMWQGGANPVYHFGSELLSWLAPATNGPSETVDVAFNHTDESANSVADENGIKGRAQILKQIDHCRTLIDKHQPDSLVVLGGDCLVDLAPFAYLSERYGDKLGVLWVDAHPDIMTSAQFNHSHATVLAALMGVGDSDLTGFVKAPIAASKVMYAGVNNESEYEANFLIEHAMQVCRPDEIRDGSSAAKIGQWIKDQGIEVLAIHLDLDVLDASKFGPLLFNRPDVAADAFEGIAQGQLTIEEVLQVIQQATAHTKTVGMGIAEHLPWDALRLRNMMRALPLLGD
ncbi:arginase family protein [Oceanobacter mangrovi]|uniref:arginase family protein n=1 Tax=Oceanobacter mangrovi TaxID=2862510 RepID=UPI001C8EE52C|nr:arginase family protein [Oceanobacter mangrovi]